MELVKSSYDPQEVTILLKDITGLVTPLPTKEREKLIQSGIHYSEMLPLEYKPTEDYMKLYKEELERNGEKTAKAVINLGDKLFNLKGPKLVLVSLARAGTPIGILLRRYIKIRYDVEVPHYTISIIRGKGIDKNAMDYILEKENSQGITFIDGWVGKGAIQRELSKSIYKYLWDKKLSERNCNVFIDSRLGVLSDPALVVPEEYCGTREDFIIPSSCLNATVSGLFSRTFRRPDIIGEKDFDGAISYMNLKSEDESINFLNAITKHIEEITKNTLNNIKESMEFKGIDEVEKIAQEYNIKDINKVKPGIGETTRVLLRRYPDRVLLAEKFKGDKDLDGIIQLCKEKNVPIEYYPLKRYKAVGIIKDVSDL